MYSGRRFRKNYWRISDKKKKKKKDYRLHLINTIENAIDNGISVYDLDVVTTRQHLPHMWHKD